MVQPESDKRQLRAPEAGSPGSRNPDSAWPSLRTDWFGAAGRSAAASRRRTRRRPAGRRDRADQDEKRAGKSAAVLDGSPMKGANVRSLIGHGFHLIATEVRADFGRVRITVIQHKPSEYKRLVGVGRASERLKGFRTGRRYRWGQGRQPHPLKGTEGPTGRRVAMVGDAWVSEGCGDGLVGSRRVRMTGSTRGFVQIGV